MPEDQVIGYVVWYWKDDTQPPTFMGWRGGEINGTTLYKIPLREWEYGEQVGAIASLMGYDHVTESNPKKYSNNFEIPREWADTYGPTN